MGRDNYGWPRYVPVGERRLQARKKLEKLKKGLEVQPVEIEGRKIARTFWGEGWCIHLEAFSDYANRLPRGRSYVRNGSVCHLEITEGNIIAIVSGSKLYNVHITIEKLSEKKWQQIKKQCAGRIGSLLELLQGKLSQNIMAVVTDREKGLFPLPGEISLNCDCPDWADMCKHVAAVLYGVGKRLDDKPELLFLLRGVSHDDLIIEGAEEAMTAGAAGRKSGKSRRVAETKLKDVFGIDLTTETAPEPRRKNSVLETGPKQGGKSSAKNTKEAAAQKISSGKITGKTVADLRSGFNMSQKQFARLLGVSVLSIYNWEKKEETLNLRERNRKALTEAANLTTEEACKRLLQ